MARNNATTTTIIDVFGQPLFCCLLWSRWKQRNNKLWYRVLDSSNSFTAGLEFGETDQKSLLLSGKNLHKDTSSVTWMRHFQQG